MAANLAAARTGLSAFYPADYAVNPPGATRTEVVIARLRHESAAGRQEIVEEIGETIRSCDAVILGCTLFPLIGGPIQEINPACALHDPGAGVAAVLPDRAGARGPNRLTVAVSGNVLTPADVQRNAAILFPGWELAEVVAP